VVDRRGHAATDSPPNRQCFPIGDVPGRGFVRRHRVRRRRQGTASGWGAAGGQRHARVRGVVLGYRVFREHAQDSAVIGYWWGDVDSLVGELAGVLGIR